MPLCLRSLPKSGINTAYPWLGILQKIIFTTNQTSEHTLIFKLFFAEGNGKKKYIFSVSLSLTKSIDAILNKNWFWFCIIPQTQVWPWYYLSISYVPTKKKFTLVIILYTFLFTIFYPCREPEIRVKWNRTSLFVPKKTYKITCNL